MIIFHPRYVRGGTQARHVLFIYHKIFFPGQALVQYLLILTLIFYEINAYLLFIHDKIVLANSR